MATSKLKGIDEPQLEGGISGAGGSGMNIKGMMKEIKAAEKQAKIDRRAGNIHSQVTPAPRSVLEEAERNKALGKFRRDQAFNEGKTEGIKTEYPYVEPTEKKKGGTVSASRRADGIAQRGKTKGKMC